MIGPRETGNPTEVGEPPLDLLLDCGGPLFWPSPLFPFQRDGVVALVQRPALLLADDMGLGKTIQAIAALRVLAHRGHMRRALVVAPAGLLIQWRRAFRQIAPEFRLCTVEGPTAERAWQWQAAAHVLIVSYETLRQDVQAGPSAPPRATYWDVAILDEAQKIKNRDVETARACKLLPRRKAWALTGTPLENKVDELASILEFTRPLEPGGPIVRVYPSRQMKEIHCQLQLRRKKSEVLADLPPIVTSTVGLRLRGAQLNAYQQAEKQGVIKLKAMGPELRIQNVLELIMRLKQLCNFDPVTGESAKLADLRERLRTLSEEGHKAIVYSQFVDDRFGVRKIEAGLSEFSPLGYSGAMNGCEKDRVVERFLKDCQCTVLIASLRAGGMGLNLQKASYVFHFDRWWNPAVEDQADGRAHRIGQRATVNVYSYVCEDTIEGRIEEILDSKRALFRDVVEGVSLDPASRLTEKELYGLFGLTPPQKPSV